MSGTAVTSLPSVQRRRRLLWRAVVALLLVLAWMPTAILTAVLMEQTGWWQRPPPLIHPRWLDVAVWYEDGSPRFQLDEMEPELRLIVAPPVGWRYSRFGPMNTHEIARQSSTSGVRADYGGVRANFTELSPQEMSDLRGPLFLFLGSHPDPQISRWARYVTATEWKQESVLWSGRLVNGSIVLACFLMAVLIPRALWLLIRAFCLGRGMLCPHCAYDLSATPGPVCPECGAANPFSTA